MDADSDTDANLTIPKRFDVRKREYGVVCPESEGGEYAFLCL